jgi:hypothetical protein
VIRINLYVHVLRITELISLIGIIGVTRLLSFSRNISIDRAGLREAARVLGDVIRSSGL